MRVSTGRAWMRRATEPCVELASLQVAMIARHERHASTRAIDVVSVQPSTEGRWLELAAIP